MERSRRTQARLDRRGCAVNSPTTTPELPLFLKVDGNLPAVDFIKRLHAGGLELVNAEDGTYAVLRLAALQEPQERTTEPLRLRLWQAAGIAHAVRHALCSDSEADHIQLQAALEAAERITDDVAGELEGWK
jgi:hypothetical protein